ncbi:trypsin, alkaline B-like [Melitaea cinxia]|uniref:trypsin, alkaline B-like n=1 Tax=Melitaea cinxia TaxID=113334 RepID=UPI001E2700EF|nr:trypsin, alkaline B-like [Melitaea cinxia]
MRALIILALGLVVATASTSASRIVGGSVTSIEQYPFAAALLSSSTGLFFGQSCGGTIINNRSVLTAAHCFNFNSQPFQWRIRVGSTNYNSGGVLVTVNMIIRHGSYNSGTGDNDVAIMRIDGAFNFNNNVRAAQIAGYNPADNALVWVIGWGVLSSGSSVPSVQLRHVQVYVVNQATCRARYDELGGRRVTDNMICSGVLDVGGRDGCQGDSGGPVLHNNIVVGITSWGRGCAQPRYPGVNARVSRYISWIQNNS